MRKWFTALALAFILGVSYPVFAQGTLSMSSVSVDIWPEYDQPAVLVIYHISLPSSTTLPATFNLQVPADAEVYAVAVSDPSAGLLNAPYERTVNGSWATLKITADNPEIQVEYYAPLVKNGTARHIVYEWSGQYAVGAFSITVQQPVGATSLTLDPALTQNSIGQDGLDYYTSMTQTLAANQAYTLTIDYQKTTDTLSTTGLPVEPAQPLNAVTPGRVTVSGVLPWVLAGVGGALIVVGVVGGIYLWKSNTHNPAENRRRHLASRQDAESKLIYCHQCGKRAQTGDVFCRNCGSRLQKVD
jgi:hypothetical protein